MIVTCYLQHLYEKCKERGYTLTEVWPCVLRQDGRQLWVDTTHPLYPAANKNIDLEKRAQIEYTATDEYLRMVDSNQTKPTKKLMAGGATYPSGPGTELKKMLSKIGITATPTCSCNKRAQIMDENGVEWCKANTDTIVSWLREEATKRGLPFIDLAGKIIVKRAISLAETAEKKRKQAKEANNAANG
jgi:hypothetical protein